MSKKFQVSQKDVNERLDKFLVIQLTDVTRSQIQKWIKRGDVTVNGKQVSKHFFLGLDDQINVEDVLEGSEHEQVSEEAPEIPIIFEDEDILVINKPAGVIVHPAQSHQQWTLVDFLREYFPGIDKVGEDPMRPGIVHRLDRAASGVMVVAKTDAAYANIKQQFVDRSVQKEYYAIVHGVPPKKTDVIKLKIARSKTKGGKMAARPEHEEGRDAWTQYDVLRVKNKQFAELKVNIKTGRTHQIRAHLAAIDHPVVGDTLYYSGHYKSRNQYPRLFLHSHRLGFAHPTTHKLVIFESEIPVEFDQLMF